MYDKTGAATGTRSDEGTRSGDAEARGPDAGLVQRKIQRRALQRRADAVQSGGGASAAGVHAGHAAASSQPAAIGRATTRSGVNVRDGAGLQTKVVGQLTAGVATDVYSVSGSWLEIRWQGHKAWITGGKDFVDYVKTPPAGAAATAKQNAGGAGGASSNAGNAGGGGGGLRGVVDAVTSTVSDAYDGVSSAVQSGIETVSSWFGGGGQTEPTQPDKETTDRIAGETGKSLAGGGQGGNTQGTTVPAGGGPAYFSQRDNEFSGAIGFKTGVTADSECNVTTLAMQLVTLAGGSIETVNRRTIELIKQNGGSGDDAALAKKQPEDLLLQLFQVLGDEYWKKVTNDKKNQPPFWNGFYDGYAGGSNGWHQVSLCLNFIGQQYTGIVGGATHYEKSDATSPEYMKGTLKPAIAAGGAVLLGTYLTGGHIVMCVGVEDDGIRINDPYGMNMGVKSKYIKNGAKVGHPEWFDDYSTAITARVKFNAELQALVADKDKRKTEVVSNWGENNFFTWDEVKTLSIGRWNNVLQKKQ